MATCRDPPELIEAFYEKWQEGYEVVYGIRVKRDATLFLKVAYKAFYRVFRATSYVPMPLDAGDFSARPKGDRRARGDAREQSVHSRHAHVVGFKQTGVPYVRPERMFGRTTNSLLRNLGWARKAVFSFSYMPLDIITALALLTVGFRLSASSRRSSPDWSLLRVFPPASRR
jgi:dolichol-phosphate mannosyltransferase